VGSNTLHASQLEPKIVPQTRQGSSLSFPPALFPWTVLNLIPGYRKMANMTRKELLSNLGHNLCPGGRLAGSLGRVVYVSEVGKPIFALAIGSWPEKKLSFKMTLFFSWHIECNSAT
jgi:hypothetical protein